MKIRSYLIKCLPVGLILALVLSVNVSSAQVNTLAAITGPGPAIVQPDEVMQQDNSDKNEKKEKKDKKRKDEFIPFVGVNFNHFTSSGAYESAMGIGYHLGFNYKRGKFFYWQVGARFNNAVFDLTNNSDSTDAVSIKDIDIPITGGINFLSFTNRILALRLFISAVPSFALDVGDNDFGIEKDDINSFMLYGQAGIGVNVAFLVIETGYNFGFQDTFKYTASKPGQVFVNIGFRF